MLFGQYLRQLRESRGLNQNQASKLLGITRMKLWDIESGKRYANKVPRGMIESFARVYKVPLGVIQSATEIKVLEKQVLSEHLADTKPLVDRAVRLTASLVEEARTYTPELEAGAIKLYNLLSDLKIRIENAYDSLYPSTQKPEAPE